MSLQNDKLISASKSGDVMTVVSLLNSGADVQIKNEVYIHFLLVTCPHLYMGPFFHSNIFMFNYAVLYSVL